MNMQFTNIPSITSVKPVILITGFLGAGKTTLLRNLLKSFQKVDLLADVILNDFSDASIDSATLDEFSESVEPLAAGCACCESLDFLLDLSLKSSKKDSDILLIELNGTADPVPIVELFTLLEQKLELHPRWQICVVDSRHIGDRDSYADIESLQLQTASHIYLSHLKTGQQQDHVIRKVREINNYAKILSLDELIHDVIELTSTRKKKFYSKGFSESNIDLHKLKKSKHHQQTHEIHSCKVILPKETTEEQVKAWLHKLPENIIRAKALIGVKGKPEYRYLFERVGTKICPYSQRVKLGKDGEHSAILIGPNLNIHDLEQSVYDFFC